MISLTDTTTTLSLDPDMLWTDEHAWSPVVHTVRYKLNGALSVHASTRLAGRPITLAGGTDYGWLTRATIRQLQTWADTPGQQLTLSLRGATYTVIFRHSEAPAIDAKPLVDFSDADDADWFVATLKLQVI